MTTRTYVCPPDHRHGTTLHCYTSHRCSCPACRAAIARWEANRRVQRYLGTWSPVVPSIGTRRRLQALVAIGWPQAELGRRLGICQSAISRQFRLDRPVCYRTTADAVVALFAELWDTPPVQDTPLLLDRARRAKKLAAKRGWLPPLAWDDIDNDPEPATIDVDVDEDESSAIDEVAVHLAVTGHHPKLTTPERREVIRILNGRGLMDTEIGELIDCAPETAYRIRKELGIRAAVGHDRMPIAS